MFDGEIWLYLIPLMLVIVVAAGAWPTGKSLPKTKARPARNMPRRLLSTGRYTPRLTRKKKTKSQNRTQTGKA